MTASPKRRLLAPECLQVSSMDCGVAAVSTLLEGYGVRVSYERLRELAQTSVDGTSIDALEEVCKAFGVDLVQHVVPPDLAVGCMRGRLPLLAVLSRGRQLFPHYVTVWGRLGPYFQIMDPAGGRRWLHVDRWASECFLHPYRLSPTDWKRWMQSNSFRDELSHRARRLLTPSAAHRALDEAFSTPEPAAIGRLDACLRLLDRAARASARSRRWDEDALRRAEKVADQGQIPPQFWTIGAERDVIVTRGTVLLAPESAHRQSGSPRARPPPSPDTSTPEAKRLIDLAGAKRTPSFFRQIYDLLPRGSRYLAWLAIVGILVVIAATTLELIVYRAAFDAVYLFPTIRARAGAFAFTFLLAATILGLEASATALTAWIGRVLELRLRAQTLHDLPRVNDHFVRSRAISDLALRAHHLAAAKDLPLTMLSVLRTVAQLLVTLAAIAAVSPAYLVRLLGGGLLLPAVFTLSTGRLRELDTRTQVFASRLLTIFLDALRGARPLRLHGYQDAFRAGQRRELEEWQRTGLHLVHWSAAMDAIQSSVALALLASLFVQFCASAGEPRTFVLLAVWAFRIPPLLQALSAFAKAYPTQRVALTRLLEITAHAPASRPVEPPPANAGGPAGAALRLSNLTVVANGNAILRDVSLAVPSGQHVAIVGRSGSGKSTLVSLLLGFHAPARGELLVDGVPLDPSAIERLRLATVWVDPSMQLWNRSVRENVAYASRDLPRRPFLEAVDASDLLHVLDNLARGLDTKVGPDGALMSGGEGQRVRLARGLLRGNPRLALLDEAFRGLERPVRARLTQAARQAWRGATILFVTHDVSHALAFDRVLVMEQGRIVEDGVPDLLRNGPTRFRQMLEAEERVHQEIWGAAEWRRVRVADGHVSDVCAR